MLGNGELLIPFKGSRKIQTGFVTCHNCRLGKKREKTKQERGKHGKGHRDGGKRHWGGAPRQWSENLAGGGGHLPAFLKGS